VKLREFTHFRAPWFSAILILSIAITPCYANQFDKASTLYDQQKYKEARKLWEKAGSAASESGAMDLGMKSIMDAPRIGTVNRLKKAIYQQCMSLVYSIIDWVMIPLEI